MGQDRDLRSSLEAAITYLDQTRALLVQGLELIKNKTVAEAISPEPPKPEDITVSGKVGRPNLSQTSNGIALWEAGLGLIDDTGQPVRGADGKQTWINIQAWRKTAIYAGDNLPSAAVATAVGRYETESWTDTNGIERERQKFVVKHFVEPK